MKKKYTYIIVLLFSLAAVLQAINIADFGVTIISRDEGETFNQYSVRDSSGDSMKLVITGEPTYQQESVMAPFMRELLQWEDLDISEIRLDFKSTRAEMIVVPDSFQCGDMSVEDNMPSGMKFYFEEYLLYDFRLKVENFFIRIKGQYFEYEPFCEKIAYAIKEPVLYIQTNDPDYMLFQISNAHTKIDDLKAYTEEALQDLLGKHEALVEDFTALKASHEELQSDHDTLQDSHDELAAEYDELREEFDSLEADYKLTKAAFQTFREGYWAFTDRTFIPTDDIPQEKIDELVARVIALKKENPDLTASDVRDKLKEEGYKTRSKTVLILYYTLYNDYRK